MASKKPFLTISNAFMLGLTIIVNWFVIALLLSIFFPTNYGLLSIIIVFALAGISLTPLAENIARFSFGCRRPTREEMSIMEEAWRAVVQAAGLDNRVYRPELFVSDQPFPNAFALGTQTVCVTRGLLRMATHEELAGVLAHEVGHLENGDTRWRMIATVINSAGNIAAAILAGILVALGYFSAFSAQFGKGMRNSTERMASNSLSSLSILSILLAMLLKGFLWILQNMITIGFLCIGRSEEFAADDFAKKIGFGNGLASFLRKMENIEVQPVGIWAAITRSHPPTAQRIDRLLYGPPEKR